MPGRHQLNMWSFEYSGAAARGGWRSDWRTFVSPEDFVAGPYKLITQPDVVVTGATGQPKVWTGSVWAQKPLKVWNGASWIEKPVKVWDGSVWKTVT